MNAWMNDKLTEHLYKENLGSLASFFNNYQPSYSNPLSTSCPIFIVLHNTAVILKGLKYLFGDIDLIIHALLDSVSYLDFIKFPNFIRC